MKKINPGFIILVITIFWMVHAEENNIGNEPQDTNSVKDSKDNIDDSIDSKENTNEAPSDTLKEHVKSDSIDSDADLLDSDSNEQGVDSLGSKSNEEGVIVDLLGTKSNEQSQELIDETISSESPEGNHAPKGIVDSEKETVLPEDGSVSPGDESEQEPEVENILDLNENSDSDDSEKPVEISKVKVIKDNVTGHKRSSFSEDKFSNRGDDIDVSHIKEEVENRILEKEKDKEISEGIVAEENGGVPPNIVEEEAPIEPKVTDSNIDIEMGNEEENLKVENIDDGIGDEKEEEGENNLKGDKNEAEDSDQEQEIPNNFLGQDEFDSSSSNISPVKTKDVTKEEVDTDMNMNSQKQKDDEEKGAETTGGHKESEPNVIKDEKSKSSKKGKKELKVQPGAKLFDDAMDLLNKKDTTKDLKLLAYRYLAEAADMSNTDAAEKIAYPYLFGDYVKRNRTKSVELFHVLAEKGIPLGQQGLGFIYGAGLNVNSSQAKALIYTTFGALGGNAMASMMLGYRYFNGIGVAKNCESALTHYKKVAKKVTDEATSHGGNAVQRIRLYDELEQPGGTSGQIDEDLLQYYQFLADKGDLQAQVGLGQLYFQGGRGIDVNYEKAFKYFQLAGDVDNGNGLAYLGKMYLDGLHVEKDQKKAFEFFTKAADQSNPIGQAGLGMIYLNGAGVKKDYDQAMKYFSLAAEQGWMEGQLQLGNMYYNGIGVKKDYRQAVKYFTFASQSGHVMAFYNLASMHATGAGVMRSCNTATELFKNVAERGKWSMMFMDAYDSYRAGDLETALLKYYYLAELGYEVAQSNVAYVLEKGELLWFSQNQTFARALLQWSRAAHQGYAVARVKVGDYHFYGYGTKVDYDAAALHYRMASDQQNNPQAMFNLGYMHEQGFGLKEDIHLAKRFYDMAAEASPDAHFPVTLALMKLTCFFTWDWVKKNYRFWESSNFERWWVYIMQKFGPDWDMYLITLLAVMLGCLLLFRRTLRR